MNKEKRTYRIYVRIADCPHIYLDGMGKGVIAYQDMTFNLPLKSYTSPSFISTLIDVEESLRKVSIETYSKRI